MKGIVFNLLETVVLAEYGEDTWDALLASARSDGVFTSLGTYPDGTMFALVEAASRALDLPPGDVLRWFGRKAMPVLAQRYPVFFTPHKSAKSFVLSVNDIIHPEVRKLHAGADVPSFDFHEQDDGTLTMGYRSARRLCALAQGFVEGAGDHFGETVHFEHPHCMHRGDDKCTFIVRFGRSAT